jgi:tetratricopeptide (TPR) repeat protein
VARGYDDEVAVRDFTRAIELAPTAPAYAGRAEIHLDRAADPPWLLSPTAIVRSDLLEMAASDAGQAIRLNPKAAAAYRVRGAVLARRGNPTEALADLDVGLGLDRQSRFGHMVRGAVRRAARRYADAAADFEAAARLPGGPAWEARNEVATTHREEAEAALKDGDLPAAAAALDRADAVREPLLRQRALLPVVLDRGADLYVRGRVLERQGRAQDAVDVLRTASAYGSGDASLQLAAMYRQGAVARNPAEAARYEQLAPTQRVKPVRVRCTVARARQPRSFRVLLTTPPEAMPQSAGPADPEADRLRTDAGAQLPDGFVFEVRRLADTAAKAKQDFITLVEDAVRRNQLPGVVEP